MANLFLQSCDTSQPLKNYESTVQTPVNLRLHVNELSAPAPIALLLPKFHPTGQAAMWGLPDKPPSRAKFGAMTAGDLILFHRRRSIFACATVAVKWESTSLAKALWPLDKWSKTSFPFVFTLSTLVEGEYPLHELPAFLGRSVNSGVGTFINDTVGAEDLTMLRSYLESTVRRVTELQERPITLFFSYSHNDATISRGLAQKLARKAGVKVWIDEGELRIGDSLIERIAGAISEIDFIVALISDSSVSSKWCREELQQATTRGINEGRVTVLPLRLGDVEMPKTIAHRYWLQVDPDNLDMAADLIHKDAKLHKSSTAGKGD